MKRVRFISALLALLAMSCMPLACDGDSDNGNGGGGGGDQEKVIFYVNDDAINSIEKGTRGHPFLTIQGAVYACQGGRIACVIRVAAGNYNESVTAHGNITFRGGFTEDFSDRDPQVNTTTINNGGAGPGISWSNPGNLTVEGFVIDNNLTGILTRAGKDGKVTISDNIISNNAPGVSHKASPTLYPPDPNVIESSLTMRDNLFYDNMGALFADSSPGVYPYNIEKTRLNLDIKYNSFYDNNIATDIASYAYDNVARISGAISNNIMMGHEFCEVMRSQADAGVASLNITLRNNINAWNNQNGRSMISEATTGYSNMYIKSVNETIAYNAYLDGYNLDGEEGVNATLDVVILNDIIGYSYGPANIGGDLVIGDNVLATYSDIFGCSLDPTCAGATGNIDADPLFTDPFTPIFDFTLGIGSPCLGTGKNGNDMGAYGNLDGGVIGSRTW